MVKLQVPVFDDRRLAMAISHLYVAYAKNMLPFIRSFAVFSP